MKIEGDERYTEIVDKQFEILGISLRFADIPEDGIVKIGKKSDYWYNVYKFTEDQEKEWRKWALEECQIFEEDAYDVFMYLDLRYGFIHTYTKIGQLF